MLAAFLLLIKKELWTRELNFNFQVHHATFGLFEIYIAAGFYDMHDYKHFQQQQKKNVVPAATSTVFDFSIFSLITASHFGK